MRLPSIYIYLNTKRSSTLKDLFYGNCDKTEMSMLLRQIKPALMFENHYVSPPKHLYIILRQI